MEITGLDFAVLNWLHSHLIPGSVPVLQAISGTTTWVSVTMILMVLVISIAKSLKPMLIQVVMLVSVLLVNAAVTQGLKTLFDRDRPFTTYPNIEKLSSGGDSSFPSGHTMEAFAMAAAIACLVSKKRLMIAVYLWAMLVAYSRMALGVHYPSDVLAGILFGTITGWAVCTVFNRLRPVILRKR